MPVLPLRIYGDPVLRTKAKAVRAVDETLRPLFSDLFDTMLAEDGVGLAAPQVGVSERVLVLAVPVKKKKRIDLTLVNPEITKSEGWELGEEGCLSVPGIFDDVKREALLQRATELAINDLGVIPLHFQVNLWATRDGITYLPRTDENTLAWKFKPAGAK